MSSWAIIIFLAVLSISALIYLGGLPRKLWEITAASVMLGLVGYALQGRPTLPATPAQMTSNNDKAAAEELIDLRADMEASFAAAKRWTTTSDAMAKNGNYSLAMAIVQGGLKEKPKNADLWAAQGLYAMLANKGRLAQPAIFAFAQTRKLNPRHPAPDYFEGLAALVEDKPLETLKKWGLALDKAPKEAQWAQKVERQREGLLAAAQAAVTEQEGTSNMPKDTTNATN